MGTLSGNVVDPDGKPVAGARIWADTFDPKTSATKRLMEARTDTEGHFRLGPVEPIYRHRYDLVVDAAGFARRSIPGGTLSVYPGRDYDLGTIALDRGRVFTGRVWDVGSKPCANAAVIPAVRRFDQGHTFTDTNSDQIVITDTDGRFRTPPLPVGVFADDPGSETTVSPCRSAADPAGWRGGSGDDPPGAGRAGLGRRERGGWNADRRGQDRRQHRV